MRLQRYKDSPSWFAELRDLSGKRRRVSCDENKGVATNTGNRLERIVKLTNLGEPLPKDLADWVATLPPHLIKRFRHFIPGNAHGKLQDLQEQFVQHLRDRGMAHNHITMVNSTITAAIKAMDAGSVGELSAPRVDAWLAGLRKDGKAVWTTNGHLQRLKSFVNWMVLHGHARANPLASVRKLNPDLTRKRVRRILEPEELRHLIISVSKHEPAGGLSGPDRAMIYWLAAETGLRAGEITSLTVGAFDFTAGTVTVEASTSKRRRRDTLPLRKDLAAALKKAMGKRHHGEKVWPLSHPRHLGPMITQDLKAAGIKPVTKAGVVDFHSLRHGFITLLARSGVPLHMTAELARHSSVELTRKYYMHLTHEDTRGALDSLPVVGLSLGKS